MKRNNIGFVFIILQPCFLERYDVHTRIKETVDAHKISLNFLIPNSMCHCFKFFYILSSTSISAVIKSLGYNWQRRRSITYNQFISHNIRNSKFSKSSQINFFSYGKKVL